MVNGKTYELIAVKIGEPGFEDVCCIRCAFVCDDELCLNNDCDNGLQGSSEIFEKRTIDHHWAEVKDNKSMESANE